MNSTQIPKDFNNIKSKFQKIDDANKRRLEIIKNKDKIEKSVSDIETIFEKLNALEEIKIGLFLNEKPEKFLKYYDTKIDEIEKRRTGLKIVQEMANEKIELLKLFPDILESEKGKEIFRKIEIINEKIEQCENEKKQMKEVKNKHELDKIIGEQVKEFLHLGSKANVIEWEINNIEFFLKNMCADKNHEVEEQLEKINKKISELTEIENKMFSMINMIIPKEAKKTHNIDEKHIDKVNKIKNKYNELKKQILEKRKDFEKIDLEEKIRLQKSFEEECNIIKEREEEKKVFDKYAKIYSAFVEYKKGQKFILKDLEDKETKEIFNLLIKNHRAIKSLLDHGIDFYHVKKEDLQFSNFIKEFEVIETSMKPLVDTLSSEKFKKAHNEGYSILIEFKRDLIEMLKNLNERKYQIIKKRNVYKSIKEKEAEDRAMYSIFGVSGVIGVAIGISCYMKAMPWKHIIIMGGVGAFASAFIIGVIYVDFVSYLKNKREEIEKLNKNNNQNV